MGIDTRLALQLTRNNMNPAKGGGKCLLLRDCPFYGLLCPVLAPAHGLVPVRQQAVPALRGHGRLVGIVALPEGLDL